MSTSLKGLNVGKLVEFGGAAIFLTGVALALEHYAIAACVISGAAAYLVGKKLSA